MIKKYRKPLIRFREMKFYLYDEIAASDNISGNMDDIIGEDEEENEGWL